MPDVSHRDLACRLHAALQGGKPANIALMQLVMAASEHSEVGAAIALAHSQAQASSAVADRLREVFLIWKSNPQAWHVVRSIANHVPHQGAGAPQTVSDWAHAFDRAAARDPDAGVALYSFGNPELLAAATAEIVEWLQHSGFLTPHMRVLDIGCGSGRLVRALAPHAALIAGVDISPEMLRVARERCCGLANVRIEQGSGQDLRGWDDADFHLAVAVDVFPYVVPMGDAIVRAYLADVVRVLKSGGALVILNFSYRGDLNRDRGDLAAFAAARGLEPREHGTSPFKLWDGIAFVLTKSPSGTGFHRDC